MRSRRAGIAIGVLILWIAGLGVLAQGEFFRPHLERLAQEAYRVNQTTTYFAVTKDARLVGYASSVIDTTQSEITVTDLEITEISGYRGKAPNTNRSKIRLSRRFWVKQFESSIETIISTRFASNVSTIRQSGTVLGDTVLSFQIITHDKPQPPVMVKLDGPFLLPRLVPLAIALTKKLAVGNTYTFPVFDPARRAIVPVKSNIDAESLFVLPDSARLDSLSKTWVPARTDTVRGWRVASGAGGFDGWIDEGGHPIATAEGGLDLKRLTYQESFENWMLINGRGKTRAQIADSVASRARNARPPRK